MMVAQGQRTSEAEAPVYDAAFFIALEEGAQRSARIASLPIMEHLAPRSVVDLGCGTGAWLAALLDHGAEEILGIDGSWVPRYQLAIPEGCFLEHDLVEPLTLERRFDLALSLEAAEHLPASVAPQLVETLTRLAPVVLFSAAVPEQKGEGHVNEQWPDYWATLFAERGYLCSTAFRDLLWEDEGVDYWYRQNLLCFADGEAAARLALLFSEDGRVAAPPLNVVHPALFMRASENLRTYAAHTAQLKSQLKNARLKLRSAEATLQSLENTLRATRGELWAIRNSLAYRIYQRMKPSWHLARRAVERLGRRTS